MIKIIFSYVDMCFPMKNRCFLEEKTVFPLQSDNSPIKGFNNNTKRTNPMRKLKICFHQKIIKKEKHNQEMYLK